MKINLIEYFEDTVKHFPQKNAVLDKDRAISFAKLRQDSLSVASNILSIKEGMNRPVAVYLNKSIESICADLGILYSGNFYMNLDVKTPAERIKNILDVISPSVIITNNQHLKNIAGMVPDSIRLLNLDEMDWEAPFDEPFIASRLQRLIDTDPSCIINTSGSTGTPKGVVLNHKSFFDFTEWALDVFKFSDDEVIGSLSPLVFDKRKYHRGYP